MYSNVLKINNNKHMVKCMDVDKEPMDLKDSSSIVLATSYGITLHTHFHSFSCRILCFNIFTSPQLH